MTCLMYYITAYCAIISLEMIPIHALPMQGVSKYEEYQVEHEISRAEANTSASRIDLKSITPPPGCQQCTDEEKYYCLGRDFINDHCCCDFRHHEELPFVPHTCYRGTTLCKTIAQDCTQYARLRVCCCQKYVSEYWKTKSSASSPIFVQDICFRLLFLYIVNTICL